MSGWPPVSAQVVAPERICGICPDGHVWEVARRWAPFRCGYRHRRGGSTAPDPTCGKGLWVLEPDEEAAWLMGGADAVRALLKARRR